jgi:hypothetical protein
MWKQWIAGIFAVAVMSAPALAQVNFSFGIEIAPPAPRVEVVPPPRPGYIWAPGFWAWEGNRHVWREGRWIAARPGKVWVPDRWHEYRAERGAHYDFEPGHWEDEHHHGHRR